jgi:putative aldouronate transport system substrate-binding protein
MKRINGAYFILFLSFFLILTACNKSKGTGDFSTSDGPVKLTVEVFDRGTDGGKTDPTNNEWTKWIKQKVLTDENIAVEFIPVTRWDENTALNNLVAAGASPDLCLTYSTELIGNYRDQGGLFDMAPYIDTTLKDLKAFLGPDMALPGRDLIRRNQDSTTGAVYSIPSRRMNTAQNNLFIRKDWLSKLNLPIPETPEEYFNALKAFKEKDPGGVGKNRVVPFTMTIDVRWTASIIVNSFIDPNLSPKDFWINSVLERYFLLPGYKEGFRFLNRMYNEGLIDRDFPLYKAEENYNNLIKSGVVGSICHNWDQIFRESAAILSDLQKNVPGADFIAIDPIKSSDGITHKHAYDAAGIFFFIPATSKNPDAAMRYINWLARYENYNFLQIGPEGIVHDVVDGIPKLKVAPSLWIQNSPQNIDYTIHMIGLDLLDPEKTIRGVANAYPWPEERIAAAYQTAMTNAKPGPVIPATLSAAGPYSQTLVDKGNIIFATSVTANPADFDRVWDAGVADWLASGAQIVLDERRAKYFEP